MRTESAIRGGILGMILVAGIPMMLAGQAGQAAAVANIRSSALTLQECVTDCPCG